MGQIQNAVNQGLSGVAKLATLDKTATVLGEQAAAEQAGIAKENFSKHEEELDKDLNAEKELVQESREGKLPIEDLKLLSEELIPETSKKADTLMEKDYYPGAVDDLMNKSKQYSDMGMNDVEASKKAFEYLYYKKQGATSLLARKQHQFKLLTDKLVNKLAGGDK